MTTLREYNANALPKKADKFIVSFYELDENVGNVLGNFVRTVDRPAISVSVSQTDYKNSPEFFHGKVQPDSISIEWYDDSESIVIDALYKQLYRQVAKDEQRTALSKSRFTVNIKFFNEMGVNVEEYNLRRCFFSSITPVNGNIAQEQATDSTIQAEVTFDDIEYVFNRENE